MKKITLQTGRSSYDRYYLIQDGRGMGGAGHPKDHPTNNWVVVNGIDRGNGYQGYMSVDYAMSDEVTWLSAEVKSAIRRHTGLEEKTSETP